MDQSPVAHVEYRHRVGSTNDLAIKLVKAEQPELPLLVLTDEQVAGRGQANRRWLASKGSLTFSYCVPSDVQNSPFLAHHDLAIGPGVESLLPLTVALAVCQTIESLTSLKPGIKWPNDIMIDHGKVAGILVEKVVAKSGIVFVIGVGVNIYNTISPDPLVAVDPTVVQPATIIGVTGYSVDLQLFLIRSLNELAQIIRRLSQDPKSVVMLAGERLVWRNEQVRISLPGEKAFSGKCVGLGSSGELLIKSREKIHTFTSGRLARHA